MEYRAVENRVAVSLESLNLPLTNEEIIAQLKCKGFTLVEVDIVALARGCVGRSQYHRGARPSQAPEVVDCSSLVKWLYGMRGIWLPRRSIQQRTLGEFVLPSDVTAGDLLFVSGFVDYYHDDPKDGVGHVGMATGEGTVVHAADSKLGVVEVSIDRFLDEKFRGARRYVPRGTEVLTFQTPAAREVETSDDLRWILLQRPRE